MKGIYGYIVTILGLVLLIVIVGVTQDNSIVEGQALNLLIPGVIFVGFIAPYHVLKNSFKSTVTIAVVVLVPIFLAINETQNATASNPTDGLGLVVIFIVLLVLALVTIGVMILLFIFGIIGSIVGKGVFPKWKFDEFADEYEYEPAY